MRVEVVFDGKARRIGKPPELLEIVHEDGLPRVVTEMRDGQVSRTEPLGEWISRQWIPDARSSMTLAEILIAEGWNP